MHIMRSSETLTGSTRAKRRANAGHRTGAWIGSSDCSSGLFAWWNMRCTGVFKRTRKKFPPKNVTKVTYWLRSTSYIDNTDQGRLLYAPLILIYKIANHCEALQRRLFFFFFFRRYYFWISPANVNEPSTTCWEYLWIDTWLKRTHKPN